MSEMLNNPVLEALVRVLRNEREAKGLNFEDLGAATGLHRTTLGLYERGERCPTIHAALRTPDEQWHRSQPHRDQRTEKAAISGRQILARF